MTVSMNNYFNKVTAQNGYFAQSVRVNFAGPQGTPGPSQPHISNLKISGHSYTDFGFPSQDEQDPSNIFWGFQDFFGGRLKEVFGVPRGRYHNIGISGNTARDGYWATLQYENPQNEWPYFPDTGVAVVMFGGNDQISGLGVNYLNSFKEGLRAIIGRYIAAKVFNYNNNDTDGAFVLNDDTYWKDVKFADMEGYLTPDRHGSGEGYWSTETVGEYLTFSTPSDYNGEYIHIGFIAGIQGATVNIYVDDVLTDTITTYDLYPSVAYGTTGRTHKLVRVPVTGEGNHEIKVECAAVTSGGAMQVNYWQIEATKHPIVLVSDAIQPSNATSIWAGMQDPDVMRTYNEYIEEVVDEWDSEYIVLVAANDAVDGDYDTWYVNKNEQYFNADGLHPNGWGGARLAKAFYNAATGIISRGVDSAHFNFGWEYETDPLYEETRYANKLYTGSGTPFTFDEFNQGYSDNGLGGEWEELAGVWGRTGDVYLGRFQHDDFRRGHSSAATLFTFGNGESQVVENFARVDNPSSLGSPWSTISGTFGVKNNKGIATAAGIAIVDTSETDHYIEGKFSFPSYGDGFVCKYVDSTNYMKIVSNVAGWIVYSVVAGVQTSLASGLHSYGDYVRVETTGSTLKYVNSGGVEASVAIPAGLAAGTKVGLFAANTNPAWDLVRYGEFTSISDDANGLAVIDTGFTDGYIAVRGSNIANNLTGLAFRVQDSDNYYTLTFAPAFSAITFGKVVAGTFSLLGSAAFGGLSGEDVVLVQMNGNNFEAFYVTETDQTSILTLTDSTYPTGTRHGMYVRRGVFDWNYCFSGFGWGETFFLPRSGDMYIDSDSGLIYGPYDADTPEWPVSATAIGGGEGLVTSVNGFTGAVVGMLYYANNLSDVQDVPTSRRNLRIDKRTTFSNANYTVLTTDVYVAQTGTLSAARTVTLPLANAVNAGYEIIVADESGTVTNTNKITVQRAGSDTLNGTTSVDILTPYAWRRFISNGVDKWTTDAGQLRDSVPNSSLATMAANTVKANATGSTATPTDVALSVGTFLGRFTSGNISEIHLPKVGRPKTGATRHFGLPGVPLSAQVTFALQANHRYYIPFDVIGEPIIIDTINFEVTTAVASSLARIGFIARTEDWQPTGAVLADSGDISTATTGVKTYTPGSPVTLQPGEYLALIHVDSAITVRAYVGSVGHGVVNSAMGTNSIIYHLRKSTAYAAFDTTAWDTYGSFSSGFWNPILFGVSDPTA